MIPSLFLNNKEKKLLRLAVTTLFIQSFQLSLEAQPKPPKMPALSIAEQLLANYDSKVNAGEVVMDLVVENQAVIPTKSFILFQNLPNPFVEETTIQFELLHSTALSLTIYNPDGVVLKEYTGNFGKGRNQIQVNGKDLKEYGVLYYQMSTENQILSKKMIYRQSDVVMSEEE